MNIIEILWRLGWDVLSFNENGEYKITLGRARKDLTDKKIEDGLISYEGSTYDVYTVKISNVCFNGLGNLCVDFDDIDTGDGIDTYEHKNMAKDELF